MATVLLAAAAALVLGVLGVVVVGLQRRVRRLDAELRSLREVVASPQPAARLSPQQTPHSAPVAERVPVITDFRAGRPEDPPVPTLARVVSVVVAGPMVKVAAFSHGVRRALDDETRVRVAYAFRKELKQQRKLQRLQPDRPPRSEGWRP